MTGERERERERGRERERERRREKRREGLVARRQQGNNRKSERLLQTSTHKKK